MDASVVCRWMPVPMPLLPVSADRMDASGRVVPFGCRGDTVFAVVAARMELLLQLIHIYQTWIKHLQCT